MQLGDNVEFTYHGSQEEYFGQRVKGQVAGFTPVIQWAGGSVPLDESGYATDVRVIDAEAGDDDGQPDDICKQQ